LLAGAARTVKAKPLRGGLRPALTSSPDAGFTSLRRRLRGKFGEKISWIKKMRNQGS
jgi:hypothetical protein